MVEQKIQQQIKVNFTYLTFMYPCIVSTILNDDQKDATI